jgi:hypothetical protein
MSFSCELVSCVHRGRDDFSVTITESVLFVKILIIWYIIIFSDFYIVSVKVCTLKNNYQDCFGGFFIT